MALFYGQYHIFVSYYYLARETGSNLTHQNSPIGPFDTVPSLTRRNLEMAHNNDYAAKIITHITENQVLLFANDYCNVNHVHSGLATTRVVIKSRGPRIFRGY